MNNSGHSPIFIVGAGVLGLNIGIALLEMNANQNIIIVEKEKEIGLHASGRNSGVIHAGFYYSKDSLKAKFCAVGNKELRKLCKENNLIVSEIGKVVVTKSESELGILKELFHRGINNDIEIELLDASKLPSIEPAARTHGKFLWSPTTAVADPIAVIHKMSENFTNKGGKILFRKEVSLTEIQNEIFLFIDGHKVSAEFIINASGVQANRLARSVEVGKEFACLPFMGTYKHAQNIEKGPKRLIYPVPHPLNPFLGVHITIMLNGDIKIGPTAIPIIGREQYSINSKINFKEIIDSFQASKALLKGRKYDLGQIIREEFPKVITKNLVNDVNSIMPGIGMVTKWRKLPPGIRAQLVNLETGELEQDFIVRKKLNSIHILNAVSPGWSSAIPFGRSIAESIN